MALKPFGTGSDVYQAKSAHLAVGFRPPADGTAAAAAVQHGMRALNAFDDELARVASDRDLTAEARVRRTEPARGRRWPRSRKRRKRSTPWLPRASARWRGCSTFHRQQMRQR